eukprot:TRINITY_DN23809_c1_g5_i1.p1 TRINITY_DN23809_c1_g5~~TRINITY_DN23809_c1_g5_i1.p1  ORF type:complete len:574 (+),score=148.37 TRINITY_DN23809_c1_g5_i1:111-1832(+)
MAETAELVPEVRITHLHGNILQAVQEPAMFSVLWGELFHMNEREFLRKTMKEEKVYFSLRDTYEINVRMVMRPETRHGLHPHMNVSVVYMLHDYEGRLTTSWTWSKFAKQMYKQGLSVIMPDFPGLGKSTVNQLPHADVETWRTQDWHIMLQITDWFKLPKVNTCSVGKSCACVIRMLQRSPLTVASEHIMLNPIFDRSELFRPIKSTAALEFSGASFHEMQLQENERELTMILRHYGVRIWACFDEKNFEQTKDTYDLLSRCTRHNICRTGADGIPEICRLVTVTMLSGEDICDVQIGVKLKLNFLHPSKRVRTAFAQWLKHEGEGADATNFMSTSLIQKKLQYMEEGEQRKKMKPIVINRRMETRRTTKGGTLAESRPLTSAQELIANSTQLTAWPMAMWPEETEGMARSLGLKTAGRGVDEDSETGSQSDGGSRGFGNRMSRRDSQGSFAMGRRSSVRMSDVMMDTSGILGEDVRKARSSLLETRRTAPQNSVSNRLDTELLAEEAAIFNDVIEESKRTAMWEREKHKEQQVAMKKFVQEAQGAGLSKGVIRYMRKSNVAGKSSSTPALR